MTQNGDQQLDSQIPGVEVLLQQCRLGMIRLEPSQAHAAVLSGALLVDTRTDTQRAVQGHLPGAVVIDRTVLEWRLDPTSSWRIPEATGLDLLIVVVCGHGFSSSLAAASLRSLGLSRATDIIGGVQAWLDAGLPTSVEPVDIRH